MSISDEDSLNSLELNSREAMPVIERIAGQDAQDAVQDACVNLLEMVRKNKLSVEKATSLRFFVTTARNAAIDNGRKSRKTRRNRKVKSVEERFLEELEAGRTENTEECRRDFEEWCERERLAAKNSGTLPLKEDLVSAEVPLDAERLAGEILKAYLEENDPGSILLLRIRDGGMTLDEIVESERQRRTSDARRGHIDPEGYADSIAVVRSKIDKKKQQWRNEPEHRIMERVVTWMKTLSEDGVDVIQSDIENVMAHLVDH